MNAWDDKNAPLIDFAHQRSQLVEALSQIFNNFLSFNEIRKLSFILNIGEAKSAEPISKFISNIYNTPGKLPEQFGGVAWLDVTYSGAGGDLFGGSTWLNQI